MPAYHTLDDVDLNGKRVLMRADLNVPLDGETVRDATRIERVIPTVKALIDGGAAVILVSHLGRPKGEVHADMSLAPVAREVERLLGRPVGFVATDWRDDKAVHATATLPARSVTVLENLRFHPGEEANDPGFVQQLSRLADVYVNDAFSAAHRAHASTEGVAHMLPAYAGRAMEAELSALAAALATPKRPVAAIVGGAKVSTKIPLLKNLTSKVDHIVIGGGMANTFLFAQGVAVGTSLCEPDFAETAREIIAEAETQNCAIVLPVDVVVAPQFKDGAPSTTVALDSVPSDQMILDVGPKSIAGVNVLIDSVSTVLWNGPFGAFEVPPFDAATVAVARHTANRTDEDKLVSIAGGGDTVAALNAAGVTDRFTYVSTAGGAFLEWLEGKDLPGVKALAG